MSPARLCVSGSFQVCFTPLPNAVRSSWSYPGAYGRGTCTSHLHVAALPMAIHGHAASAKGLH